MTEEEKTLKYLSAMRIIDFNQFGFIYGKETIDEVLNLVQKQQEEIEKKDKIIDDMAECLAYSTSTPLQEKDYCFKSIQCEVVGGSLRCPDCIKQYFERKVEV